MKVRWSEGNHDGAIRIVENEDGELEPQQFDQYYRDQSEEPPFIEHGECDHCSRDGGVYEQDGVQLCSYCAGFEDEGEDVSPQYWNDGWASLWTSQEPETQRDILWNLVVNFVQERGTDQ